MELGREKAKLVKITGGKFHRKSIVFHVVNRDKNYEYVIRKVNSTTINMLLVLNSISLYVLTIYVNVSDIKSKIVSPL